jgi:hypothetical protein
MWQYLDLLGHVLENGKRREDRTGTGTLGVFGCQIRFDLREGFPLVTTKKVHMKSIVHELLWFLRSQAAKPEHTPLSVFATCSRYFLLQDRHVSRHDRRSCVQESAPHGGS